MLGLVGWDEGGSGFVNASVRTVTNSRQVGLRTQKNTQARIDILDANNTSKEWNRQKVAQAMTQRIRGNFHENDRNNKTSLARDQMKQFSRHVLLSLWEGWHWDDTKGG